MKRGLVLFILALLSFAVHAQDCPPANALKEINNIKMSGNYVWAEGSSIKSENEAQENALAVLNYEIQNLLNATENKDIVVVISQNKDNRKTIQTKRGNLYRTFVYINKELINSFKKKEIYEPNEFEKQMLTVTKASDIETFVKQSSIFKYGKYKERPDDGDYYLLVYNREGNIPACLKFSNGKLTNVATGADDSFQNYKGCGAYWFIKNNRKK